MFSEFVWDPIIPCSTTCCDGNPPPPCLAAVRSRSLHPSPKAAAMGSGAERLPSSASTPPESATGIWLGGKNVIGTSMMVAAINLKNGGLRLESPINIGKSPLADGEQNGHLKWKAGHQSITISKAPELRKRTGDVDRRWPSADLSPHHALPGDAQNCLSAHISIENCIKI